jgi:hypothetical protein
MAALVLVLLIIAPHAGLPQAQEADRTVIYVDRDATGPTHDGTSWATAYTTLQEALDESNADGTTDYEIWVAEGVYYPDEGSGHSADDPAEWFRIEWDNAQLYGGFAGDETDREERDWLAHLTVLSGDVDGDDLDDDGNGVAETWNDVQGNNAYHVLYLDGETYEPVSDATVIDGFAITAGNAAASGAAGVGGGLFCSGSGSGQACSPMLTNVTFSGNSAH